MEAWGIFDSKFSHVDFSSPGLRSKHMVWDRTTPLANDKVFFSHEFMSSDIRLSIPKKNRYGLLIESQSIVPEIYSSVSKYISDYELVFTHSSELLNSFANTRWIPGSGVWIGGDYGGSKIASHEKTKICSILSSNKLKTKLHRFRIVSALLLMIPPNNKRVDVFIQKPFSQNRIQASEVLENYAYSVCIENFIDEEYFTEKILNCFATGTIPIYRGAKSISKHFNSNGIITFSSFRELMQIVKRVNLEDYKKRQDAIQENMNRSQEYRLIEDYIYERYLSINQ